MPQLEAAQPEASKSLQSILANLLPAAQTGANAQHPHELSSTSTILRCSHLKQPQLTKAGLPIARALDMDTLCHSPGHIAASMLLDSPYKDDTQLGHAIQTLHSLQQPLPAGQIPLLLDNQQGCQLPIQTVGNSHAIAGQGTFAPHPLPLPLPLRVQTQYPWVLSDSASAENAADSRSGTSYTQRTSCIYSSVGLDKPDILQPFYRNRSRGRYMQPKTAGTNTSISHLLADLKSSWAAKDHSPHHQQHHEQWQQQLQQHHEHVESCSSLGHEQEWAIKALANTHDVPLQVSDLPVSRGLEPHGSGSDAVHGSFFENNNIALCAATAAGTVQAADHHTSDILGRNVEALLLREALGLHHELPMPAVHEEPVSACTTAIATAAQSNQETIHRGEKMHVETDAEASRIGVTQLHCSRPAGCPVPQLFSPQPYHISRQATSLTNRHTESRVVSGSDMQGYSDSPAQTWLITSSTCIKPLRPSQHQNEHIQQSQNQLPAVEGSSIHHTSSKPPKTKSAILLQMPQDVNMTQASKQHGNERHAVVVNAEPTVAMDRKSSLEQQTHLLLFGASNQQPNIQRSDHNENQTQQTQQQQERLISDTGNQEQPQPGSPSSDDECDATGQHALLNFLLGKVQRLRCQRTRHAVLKAWRCWATQHAIDTRLLEAVCKLYQEKLLHGTFNAWAACARHRPARHTRSTGTSSSSSVPRRISEHSSCSNASIRSSLKPRSHTTTQQEPTDGTKRLHISSSCDHVSHNMTAQVQRLLKHEMNVPEDASARFSDLHRMLLNMEQLLESNAAATRNRAGKTAATCVLNHNKVANAMVGASLDRVGAQRLRHSSCVADVRHTLQQPNNTGNPQNKRDEHHGVSRQQLCEHHTTTFRPFCSRSAYDSAALKPNCSKRQTCDSDLHIEESDASMQQPSTLQQAEDLPSCRQQQPQEAINGVRQTVRGLSLKAWHTCNTEQDDFDDADYRSESKEYDEDFNLSDEEKRLCNEIHHLNAKLYPMHHDDLAATVRAVT